MQSFIEIVAKENPKNIIVDLVKRVLENRLDIKPNSDFIHDVANYTVEKTQVEMFITEFLIVNKTSFNLQEDYKLGRIIELIAIVNRAIDVISLRDTSTNYFFR